MRGRTVSPINTSAWKSASYVQINIYDASLKRLREEGVDIKHMLQHTGYRCVIMEVPIISHNLTAVQPSTRRVKSFGGFHDYPENDEEYDIGEAAIKDETASATTLLNSFVVSADEGRRGPLTSTPITEKHGGCFDDFIFGNSCGGSQKFETDMDSRLQNGPACTKTPTRHHESSGGASSLKVADVDEMTLFQECVDDFDGVLRSANSHDEKSERLTEGAFLMSVANVAGHGRDAAVSMASSIADAQANIMPLPLVKDITAPNTSLFTSEVMEIEEPGINEDTLVANPPFDSLPHQIRKGIETVNSVMADLDTAMLCYDLPGCSNDANYSCSSVGKLPYDRKIPGVFSSIEKCPPEEVLRCQAKGTHELNFLSSEDEGQESLQNVTSGTLMQCTEATSNEITRVARPSTSSKRDATNFQSTSSSDVERIATQLKQASISHEFTSVGNESTPDNNTTRKSAESSAQPENKRNGYAPSLLNRIEEQLSFGKGDHCGGEVSENDDALPCVVAESYKIFRCQMPGCGKKLLWRRQYGKHRLVDHVRTHWSNAVKLCKICDYKASCPRKVYRHHKIKHSNTPYTGATSAETNEDMQQLLLLWKRCFPGIKLNQSQKLQVPHLNNRNTGYETSGIMSSLH